jgi:outer membrane protein assembly factor BamA
MIFRWTEIHIKGDSSISVNAIENSIGIRKGDYFNESLLAQVDKRIEQLSFITKIKASELLFTEKGVELFLYLKSQKISSVQGAIGLQPNPITQTMVLTGDLQMKLANVFKKAESVDLSWRSIQPQTQSLNFKLIYPYLFKSPFGIDARFNLYKRDSTFLDLKSALGVVYTLKNGSQLKASYQLLASNLLFASASSSQFSNLATVRTNSYGISYTQRKLDYIPNPSKGRFLNVEAFIGSRTATKDSVSEKKNVARASIQFDNYFSLAKRHVLKLSAGFETYYAPQVFQNELYRFGGLNSLRGFNEDELFASTKLSYTLEYRFLVDRNSNAFLFFEQAFYENNSSNYLKDNPFGVGTGFSFGTKLGIFTISYAVGKQLTNPFDFRLSKIHFGYTAYF